MLSGVIATIGGVNFLLIVWAFLAELLAIALTAVVLLRKAPPLTTQVDRQTGIKQHGLLNWLGGFSAALTCLPVVILGFRLIGAFLSWSLHNWWIYAVLGVAAALIYGTRHMLRTMPKVEYVEQQPLPHNPIPRETFIPIPEPQTQQIWSAPVSTENWSQQ